MRLSKSKKKCHRESLKKSIAYRYIYLLFSMVLHYNKNVGLSRVLPQKMFCKTAKKVTATARQSHGKRHFALPRLCRVVAASITASIAAQLPCSYRVVSRAVTASISTRIYAGIFTHIYVGISTRTFTSIYIKLN
jgi:hypothetical protein